MRVTNSDIAAWQRTIENNYNRYKREHAAARAAGDRRKMQSVGRKMKATLRDGKTWSNLVAAERALGAK
jgi:murein L,D-transpeptidase YcbB/YkuD